MTKRMLIDATHDEETRVVILDGNRLEEFDFETSTKKQIKGNIYLAKVTRVEPSLQAAFVDYGENRHGFLAFSEIHPDYYRIPVADREALLREHAAMAEDDADDIEQLDSGPANARGAASHAIDSHGDAAPPPEDAPGAPIDPPERDTTAAEETRAADTAADDDGTAAAPVDTSVTEAVADAGGGLDSTGDMAADTASGPRPRRRRPRRNTKAASARTSASVSEPAGDDGDTATRPRLPSYRRYKIQEVIKRRQILLVQVTKEERGNKGAALTTYLSLAGRYCVLMPNTARGGGISRKIGSVADRKRLKIILEDLNIPNGMAVIVRTAGSERSKAEVKRDYDYLMRLWEDIRTTTLQSMAPCLIHEEGNLIKRSIRDLYARDIDEVQVEGDEGYKTAKAFMRMLMPSHAKRVQPYKDTDIPLFHRYQVENQLDAIFNPVAQLRSGGSIVIQATEALVSIDVNSGRSTKERHIEETALKTNLEAADEVARQLRLRDLAGLIVVDFIDMEESRHNAQVERRLREAMKNDRARIQFGRISGFGLLELSRQRMRPSLQETMATLCPHCAGSGFQRSTESTALHVLRAVEEEGIRHRSSEIALHVPTGIALYILNQKRRALAGIEERYGFSVMVAADDSLIPPDFRLERRRGLVIDGEAEEAPDAEKVADRRPPPPEQAVSADTVAEDEDGSRRRRRRRRRRGDDEEARTAEPDQPPDPVAAAAVDDDDDQGDGATPATGDGDIEASGDDGARKRRRGKRGGRRRGRRDGDIAADTVDDSSGDTTGDTTGEERIADADGETATGTVAIAVDDPAGPAVPTDLNDGVSSPVALNAAGLEITAGTEPVADGQGDAVVPADAAAGAGLAAEAVATDKPKRPRRSRTRKPKADAEADQGPVDRLLPGPAPADLSLSEVLDAAGVVAEPEAVPAVANDIADQAGAVIVTGGDNEPADGEIADDLVAARGNGTGPGGQAGNGDADSTAAVTLPPEKPKEPPRRGWWQRLLD